MTKLSICEYCNKEYMRSDTPHRNIPKHKFCSIHCRIEGLKGTRFTWAKKPEQIEQIKEFMGWK